MKNIFKFDEYNEKIINESHVENESIVAAFLKVGVIKMADGTLHKPIEFVDVVNSALVMFQQKYSYEYTYIKNARIVYLLDGTITKTMCTDISGNMYINVEFLYSFLYMNIKYIMYILYHEVMHCILEHVKRGIEYGKSMNNKLTWDELNECSDYEVNCTMVADRVCTPDVWDNLKGCFSDKYLGFTFEQIANIKNKLAKNKPEIKWNPKKGNPNNKSKNEKSPDYKKGYADMKEAIKSLIRKNKGDEKTTIKQLTSIFAKTNEPELILSEINNLVNAAIQFKLIMSSELFESSTKNADWINGLSDCFNDEIKNLSNNSNSDDSNGSMDKEDDESGDNDEDKQVGESGDGGQDSEGDDEDESENGGEGEDGKDGEDDKDGKDGKDGEEGKEDKDGEEGKDGKEGGKNEKENGSKNSKGNKINGEDEKPNDDDISNSSAKTDINSGDLNKSVVGAIIDPSYISNNIEKSLKNSGYDTDDINSIRDELLNQHVPTSSEMTNIRDSIMLNKPNTTLSKLCKNINIDETVIEGLWQKLVEKFLQRTTVRKGSDSKIEDEKSVLWGNKRYLHMSDDFIMPYHGKTDASPQYINIFLDCSGSINITKSMAFVKIIFGLCGKLEFSGIRIIPFGDYVDEKHIFSCVGDDLKNSDINDEIQNFIYKCGTSHYGGVGNSTSFLCTSSFIHKFDSVEPDSVYLVFSDGKLFDTQNIKKFKPFFQRVLFCIIHENIKNYLKSSHNLYWCIDPNYNYIDKVYIELSE